MTWGKCLLISLGLILLSHVAHAREIESFTDSRGTLHITNLGTKNPKSPANPASPAPPFPPRSFPGKAPVPPPPNKLAPEAQAPGPKPEAAPTGPLPVNPPAGSQVTHPEGLGKLMQLTHRQGQIGMGRAPETPVPPLRQVSWSPPHPVKAAAPGKIAIHRDRHGVIHITNVPQEGEEPAAADVPAQVVQKQVLPPAAALPAVQKVSYPELGPEVAEYLKANLLDYSPALTRDTIQRYKDHRGVWHIRNAPAPDLQLPQPRLAAPARRITVPALAHGPPLPPTPPARAWGPGFVMPPPGPPDQRVLARRDHRGVLHVFTSASGDFRPDRDSPGYFLRRVPPAVQSYIIEAAQLNRLPASLILALIRKESNFAHQAVSPKGAMGLMQLMPGTAASLGVQDPFDPRENILAGCRYFRYMLDYFRGNVPLALAGYNAGYHRVISAGFRVPAIKETQEFVTQVMGLYYLLEKQADSL